MFGTKVPKLFCSLSGSLELLAEQQEKNRCRVPFLSHVNLYAREVRSQSWFKPIQRPVELWRHLRVVTAPHGTQSSPVWFCFVKEHLLRITVNNFAHKTEIMLFMTQRGRLSQAEMWKEMNSSWDLVFHQPAESTELTARPSRQSL